MDTGWSLTDLELDDLEPQTDEAQVQLCQCQPVFLANISSAASAFVLSAKYRPYWCTACR